VNDLLLNLYPAHFVKLSQCQLYTATYLPSRV